MNLRRKTFIGLVLVMSMSVSLADSAKSPIEQAEKAIEKLDVAALENLLVNHLVGANAATEKGSPLLMFALRQSYTMDSDDIDPIVTTLLRHGADPNIVENFRGFPETPMVVSIRMGRPGISALLIKSHADVNQQICYVSKPGWLSKLLGEKKGLNYGTVLDAAEKQLEAEVAFNDGWQVSQLTSIISQLKAAGAVHWDPSTMHCDASNAMSTAVAPNDKE